MVTIDFANYVRGPRITASGGVVLGIRLLRSAPLDPTPAELAALARMRAAAMAVQDAVGERHRTSGSSLRPFDRRFDGCWAALHGRLVAWTRMLERPEAERALALLAKLFPNGLQFLVSSYEAEWFHSRMLLDRMHKDDLYDDVVELAGEPIVTGVEQAHAALGEALGLDGDVSPDADAGASSGASSGLGVGESVLRLADAIANYGRILSGNVEIDDPDSRARFLRAVAPIDAYRARNRRSSSDGDPSQALNEADGDSEEFADIDEPDGLDLDSPIPPIPAGG
jgi:hypothetical protein